MTTNPRHVSRRKFLGLSTTVGLASATAPLLLSSSCGENLPEVKRGQEIATAAELKPGSALTFTDTATNKPGVLIHLKSGEFVAYSAECTHQGCTVTYRAKDGGYLACPCHNSVFEPTESGKVVSGPADEPLPRLGIEVRDGRIFRA
jgi:Rieske Fe-S protein